MFLVIIISTPQIFASAAFLVGIFNSQPRTITNVAEAGGNVEASHSGFLDIAETNGYVENFTANEGWSSFSDAI